MAQPRTVTADGRTEDEYRLDINRAIADTEDEIFREAMGDQELDNDGDTSLEQMGEGPGGDVIEDDEEAEGEEAGDEEALQAEGGEPEEEEPDDEHDEEQGEGQAGDLQPNGRG